ncbi:MAG: class I SAM-dependent methyltransferase [Planctomycetia bacterium]
MTSGTTHGGRPPTIGRRTARHGASRLSEAEAAAVACPLCTGRAASPVARFEGAGDGRWRVVECHACGTQYTSPQADDVPWDDLYPRDYGPYQVKPPRDRWHSAWRRRFIETLFVPAAPGIVDRCRRRLAGRYDPYLAAPTGKRRLLDVGCGGGRYLHRMRGLGWEVLGLDRSEHAAESARGAYDVPVVVGTLPDDALAGERFDLVTAWEVLEHVDTPRRFLGGVRDLLADDGELRLTVPNTAGWAAQTFGPDWIGLDLPRHRAHYTPATLAAMVQAAGLAVVSCRTIGHSSWVRHSARACSPLARLWWGGRVGSRAASYAARLFGRGEALFVVARRP